MTERKSIPPLLQKAQFLQDISITNKIMNKLREEKDIIGKMNLKEELHHHLQTMRLKYFFRVTVTGTSV